MSYLAHTYRIRYKATASLSDFMERQLEELKAKMEKSSAAVAQFERELNVINPEEKTSILSARLLELNSEYTKAQADRVKKEAAFNSVQSGTLEAAQVSTQGEALKKLTENLNEAREKFAEVKNHYGSNHPEYKKAQTRVQELESQTRQHRRQRRAARGGGISRGGEPRSHDFERGAGDQDRVRPPERALLRIPDAEARSRRRQEAVRRTGAQDQGSGHQRQLPEQLDSRGRSGAARIEAGVSEDLAESCCWRFCLRRSWRWAVAVVSDVLDNTVRDPDQVTRLMNDRSDRIAAGGEGLAAQAESDQCACERRPH